MSCTVSLLTCEFLIGSLFAINHSEIRKASYAIDTIALNNNATFVDYEFPFNNFESQKLNSRSYFREEYDIETESVMLVTSFYSHSRILTKDISITYENSPLLINTAISMTNLTFCFDFNCVLTKTSLPKNRIGISESLAKKILYKDENYEFTDADIYELSQKVINVKLDNLYLECAIYCYYKSSSKQSYFNRYLNGDFIVFHETEISPSKYSYVLTAVSYSQQVYKILNKLKYPDNAFEISLININFEHKNIRNDIKAYIDKLNIRNSFLLYSLCLLVSGGCYVAFVFIKNKNRYLIFILSLVLTDLIKHWILRFTTTPLIFVTFANFHCYLVILLFLILLIKKKYLNE